jgi:hypothetical protein
VTYEERLVALTGGADAIPALSPEELADCLLRAAVPDNSNNYVNDDDWTPSYDINRAAANAWRLKAAKLATDYTITIEGRELQRGQMIDNALKMASEYDTKAQPRYMAAPDTTQPWRI